MLRLPCQHLSSSLLRQSSNSLKHSSRKRCRSRTNSNCRCKSCTLHSSPCKVTTRRRWRPNMSTRT
eukprot:11308609-Karenia_brevis.AAC.1